MLDLINAADSSHCHNPRAAVPRPQERLRVKGVLGIGKYRGAIANEMARRAGRDYGPFVEKMLNEAADETDSGFLDWLERQPASEVKEVGDIPAAFSHSAEFALSDCSPPTIASFCRNISADWDCLDDEELLELLTVTENR